MLKHILNLNFLWVQKLHFENDKIPASAITEIIKYNWYNDCTWLGGGMFGNQRP